MLVNIHSSVVSYIKLILEHKSEKLLIYESIYLLLTQDERMKGEKHYRGTHERDKLKLCFKTLERSLIFKKSAKVERFVHFTQLKSLFPLVVERFKWSFSLDVMMPERCLYWK